MLDRIALHCVSYVAFYCLVVLPLIVLHCVFCVLLCILCCLALHYILRQLPGSALLRYIVLHCIMFLMFPSIVLLHLIVLHCVALHYILRQLPGSALLRINTNYCSCPGSARLLSVAAGNRRGHDTSITRLRAVIQTSHWEEERRQKQRIIRKTSPHPPLNPWYSNKLDLTYDNIPQGIAMISSSSSCPQWFQLIHLVSFSLHNVKVVWG